MSSTQQTDFDTLSERYEDWTNSPVLLRLGGEQSEDYIRYKVQELLKVFERHRCNSREAAVLDVGCGTGIAEQFLAPHCRLAVGVDPSRGMLQRAEALHLSGCAFRQYDDARLPFSDASV